MPVSVSDYLDVDTRVAELGLQPPSDITLLPLRFDEAASITDLRTSTEASTIRTLLRNAEIPLGSVLPAGERLTVQQNNSFSFVAPTLFVAGAVVSQNPLFISLSLNVIGTYLTDFLRGTKSPTVKLDIVVEQTKGRSYRKVTYEGDIAGLQSLPEIIQAAAVDE